MRVESEKVRFHMGEGSDALFTIEIQAPAEWYSTFVKLCRITDKLFYSRLLHSKAVAAGEKPPCLTCGDVPHDS